MGNKVVERDERQTVVEPSIENVFKIKPVPSSPAAVINLQTMPCGPSGVVLVFPEALF
jgi:hypothetical protein